MRITRPATEAMLPPPPKSGGMSMQDSQWKSKAVNRSSEFLSCCRTALKLGQQRYKQRQRQKQNGQASPPNDGKDDEFPDWLAEINPADLALYHAPPSSAVEQCNGHDTATLIKDSQTLLQLMDTQLSELHSLVRRRGHTNDPTLEIQTNMERFQESAKEVKVVCDSIKLEGSQPCKTLHRGEYTNRRSSGQRRKHYELVSQQLEGRAKERTDQLKKELELRSKVLRDQTQRRKLLATGGGVARSNDSNGNTARAQIPQPASRRLPAQSRIVSNKASSQFHSPLFTATSGSGNIAAYSSSYAGYGGAATASTATSNSATKEQGYAGYGGTAPTFSTGMRQRKHEPIKSSIQIDNGADDDDKYSKSGSSVQEQITMRREARATRNRAQQARAAERAIAELGGMFAKMSTLISQQGEMLERIEDDVEAAGAEIDAGHDELVKVYGMTKGNRGLILKVFAILIFLIIFMKLY